MVRLFSTLCLGILLVGCSGRKLVTEESDAKGLFADSVDVQWTYLAGDNKMPSGSCILVADSCVYLLGEAGGQWVRAYNVGTGAEEGTYVRRRLPVGDLLNATQLSKDPKTGDFGVFNQGIYDRYIIRFTPDFEPVCMYNVDSLFPVNDMMLVAPNRMIVTSTVLENGKATGRTALNLLDISDGISVISTYDEVPSPTPRGIRNKLAVAPSAKKVAMVSVRAGILQTFSFENDSITRLSINNFFPIEVTDDGIGIVNRRSSYGFGCVAASDEYVYATYSESHAEGVPATTIGVWDWKGNPVRKMKVNLRVKYMTVSPDGKRLYGLLSTKGAGYSIEYIEL